MAFRDFLFHQWLAFRRGKNSGKSLFFQIIILVFYFLIFLEIAAVGILLPYLIHDLKPGEQPIQVFTAYLLYYFIFGLLARFQWQRLPALSIQPYLLQNIRRKYLLRFLDARSLLHIVNFLPLFIFIPFTVTEISPVYGLIPSLFFLLSMFGFVLNNHYLNMYFKRKSINHANYLIGILVTIFLLKFLDHLQLIPVEQTSSLLFTTFLYYPILSLVPVGLAIGSREINNRYVRNHLYLEELVKEKPAQSGREYTWLKWMGDTGEMMALDLKLIFRNKRPRSIIIFSGVILLYGLLFYPQYIETENFGMLFFFAILIAGMFISNYGQFLFAWQSSHFDGMMTYQINMYQYIRSKFYLFLMICMIQFLLTAFYGLLNWRIIPIQAAAFLYSIGVNSFITIYAATFNYAYLDLGRSSSLNFQGVGAKQWLQSLAISFGPALLFYLILTTAGYWPAIFCITLPGIIGLIFYKPCLKWLAKQFNSRKHTILDGFRQR